MEALRRRIRQWVGHTSWLYGVASKLITLAAAFSRDGAKGVGVVLLKNRHGPGRWVKLRDLQLPIFIRPGTEDITSITDNVFRHEYGQLPPGFVPLTIVDAGAYIGDTAAYFLSCFDSATVVALEPTAASFALAKDNLEGYGNRATILKAALMATDGEVRISGSETGAAVDEQGELVRAISMATLMKEMGIEVVDLLKMDIEGAEVGVLDQSATDWLAKVRYLLLETHGSEIEQQVLPFLEKNGFRIWRHRNVWYCENLAAN